MTASIANVTSKGQITIPKEIRQAMQIGENDQILILVEEDRAIMIPLRKRPIRELRGALPAARPYPGIEELREAARQEMVETRLRDEKPRSEE